MRYCDIEPMCKPRGMVRGCPHDGLGCVGGPRCSINREDSRDRAWVATNFGPDFCCVKHEATKQLHPQVHGQEPKS